MIVDVWIIIEIDQTA